MDNRVYYGEYSLKHWIDLILKKNIILPEYQRFFVWNENKTKVLIETFKKKQFVPPITIGSFKENGINRNLILDGQQRLTSILLAYIGIFPDKKTFQKLISKFADENDNPDEDDDEQFDNVFEWTFNELIKKGSSKEKILSQLKEGNYKNINFNIDENFFKSTFLGFSYLVPEITDEKEKVQQKYYSSVFRNINIQGESLLPQESRASLYYLDKDLAKYFKPDFSITINNSSSESKMDFVRYLALLSQYYKDKNANKVARSYGRKMEKYYEEYIYSVVGENDSKIFVPFSEVFPDKNYKSTFELISSTFNSLELPKVYTSIIDLDLHLFGLLYFIIFQKKSINSTKKIELKDELSLKIIKLKQTEFHSRNPSALKYLRARINESISIYRKYTNE